MAALVKSVCLAALLAATAVTGPAASRDGAKSVEAKQVFSDKGAALLGDAVASGDTARIAKLIKGGANPSAVGDQGTSLLQWAMLNRSKAGFEALLAAGADATHADDAGDTVMHYAARANDVAYLDILLTRQLDPNVPNGVTGATPLMAALFGGRDAQFQKLRAAGAKVNLTDRMGNTALHIAAKINDYAHALDLLNAGAEPMAHNKQGVTFQRYLKMTPPNILLDEARRQRESVLGWLREHNVAIE